MTRPRVMSLLRKLVQISMFGFMVYVALSAHWRNFKVAHNSARITSLMTNDVWGELYRLNETLLSWFGEPLAVSEGWLGGPWAATVAGVPVIDPLVVLASLVSGNVPTAAMLLGASLPLVAALVLGKVFCSFLCPARLLFEVGNASRRGLLWLGVPLPEIEVPRIGLWVGLGGLLFAVSAGPGVFHFLLPYLSISSAISGWILGGVAVSALWWVMILVAVDTFVAPGQFCRSICPTGALLEQVGRFSLLRLVRDDPACPPSCDLCQRACPYGLYPGKRTHTPACDTCGACIGACPRDKLSRRLAIAPKTSKVAVIVLAVAWGLCLPSPAQAHHNKGLPHYGYFENYPQVPTEEFIDEVGRWEVGTVLFNFQGMKRKTSDTPDDVRIFAYVYDLETDRGYKGPIVLRIEQHGNQIARFERSAVDQEGVYLLRQTMPSSGWYQVIFELDVDGQHVEVPLDVEVDLNADQVPWTLLGGAGLSLLVIFVLAAYGRKSRALRHAPAPKEA